MVEEYYPEIEKALYEMIRNGEPLTRMHNYRDANSKAKWFIVGYFEVEPKDWPSNSKEIVECARFIAEGDAYLYANLLARRPSASRWWAVVVR